MGWVRHLRERLLALFLGGGELALQRAQLLFDAFQLLELLGRRLPVDLLLCAQLVDLRHECAPTLVCSEERVECGGGTAPRESSAHGVPALAGCAQVDHRAKNASRTCATPSSSTD